VTRQHDAIVKLVRGRTADGIGQQNRCARARVTRSARTAQCWRGASDGSRERGLRRA